MWSLLAVFVSEFRWCFTLCLFIILSVQFGFLSGTFWEIAARSVSNLFSLYFVYFEYTERQKSCTTHIFAFFLQIEIVFEILKLDLTYTYNSLYFNVFPSNLSFVVLSI